MADDAPTTGEPRESADAISADDETLRAGVIVGVVPGLSSRVVKEGARYAALLNAPLVAVHVDVTRFVTYEDPDGYVHSAPIDLHTATGAEELEIVKQEVGVLLEGRGIPWVVRQLVGDPALAMKQLADQIDARLLVVGTRRRGIGESIREFFTGSVAARLAHRQRRPILVVPLGEPVSDDEEIWPAS